MGECKDKDVFEQLKPALFYWASRYKSRQFEYWELVNAAWASDRWRRVKPEYYFQAIRYAIQDYVRDNNGGRRKRYFKRIGRNWPKKYSLDNITIGATNDESFQRLEQLDFIDTITKGLSRVQRLVVKLRYIEGYNFPEIAAVIGLSPSRISQIHKNITQILRCKMAEN